MSKKYSDFMNEISSDVLYKGLLAHGLFSEKLPPIFTSQSFYEYCMQKRHNFEPKPHCYIYYENMRNINIPRPLAIPNPMAYQLLCKSLADNWDKLKQHFLTNTSGDSYKVSRIHFRKMHQTSALFKMNYSNWRTDGSPEPSVNFGKRYLVKADISSCFPSIYTHSLAWALVTKNAAKASQKNADEWYNEIDFYTSLTKFNETHGLLIGPHTSNLLSEIVLTTVDKQLSHWTYIRNIDDYKCYVDTYEDGQHFLAELGAALRAFDLSLNHKKTEICELPLAIVEHWQRKLNGVILLTDYGKVDYKHARAYLDLAIELMRDNKGNASILKYAVKVLSNQELTYNAREYCAKSIMNLSLIYPYMIALLDEFVFQKYCVDCEQNYDCIRQYSDMAYKKGIQMRNYEQIAYALYFAMKYRFDIGGFSIQDSIDSGDCLFLLFSYLYVHMYKRSKTDTTKLKEHAKILCADDESMDQFWLLIYEALPKDKLPNSEWKGLKGAKVSFIRPVEEW